VAELAVRVAMTDDDIESIEEGERSPPFPCCAASPPPSTPTSASPPDTTLAPSGSKHAPPESRPTTHAYGWHLSFGTAVLGELATGDR
jgi:hypothetical protein